MFAHGFNIHFGRIDPPGIVDVGHGRAQGPRPPRSAASTRRAAACRPCSPSSATRPARPAPATLAYARALGSHPRRRPRDDVRGGDRDRPVRRAVRPVRRHLGARQDGVRDARRGRLPARARLLRDDARAQAHRRPDVPRRPQLHALQRQRHRRVRRLRQRPADHRRARPRDDAGRPRATSRTARSPTAGSPRTTPAAHEFERLRAADRDHQIEQVGGAAARPDAVPRTRSRSRPARPRPRPRRPGRSR